MFDLIRYFVKIKKFIGKRIYVLLSLMIMVGFIEGIGITLFLPILQNGFGDDKLSRMLKTVFGFFRLDFSFRLFLLLIPVFFILRALFLICYARYSSKLTSNLLVTLRRKVAESAFAARYLYLLKKEVGYINNAIVREVAGMVDAFKSFSNVLKHTLLALIYLSLSLALNFKISIIAIALSPIIVLLMRRINAATNRTSLECSKSYARFHSLLIQGLSKFKYLKSTLSHRRISEIIERENRHLGNLRFKLLFLQALAKDAFEPLIVLAIVGLLFYYVVALGRNVNEIIFLIFLFLQVARQFLTRQTSYRKFLASMGSIETFNTFEKELEENKEELNPAGAEPDFDSDIVFKNTTVVFPNGKKGLDDVTITIRPNSMVALVGHSGSGKSTVVNLITGLLQPTSGDIFFGTVSYSGLNLKTLRGNIGYVTQEDVIFNSSIKDNISLWEPQVNSRRLAKVIDMAHISGFVENLPDKEGTLLGDNGLDISGGQRQRITIARELYKDTKLLIFDEATSSLDSTSEKQIYENLNELKGKKTMIVVAHRLSTIKNADYIYVLEDGKVIEEGAYDDLVKRHGRFTRMIQDQSLVTA